MIREIPPTNSYSQARLSPSAAARSGACGREPFIAALGKAAEIAVRDQAKRLQANRRIREQALTAFAALNPRFTGEPSLSLDHVVNLAFPGLDSEALMVALKDLVAISNGSACTSSSYTPSHVLKAMDLSDDEANACVRISWCHLTPEIDWNAIVKRIGGLR